jgi:hypothetical protein
MTKNAYRNSWGHHFDGIGHPDVAAPKFSMMLDGLPTMEKLILEGIATEAKDLGVPLEDLLPHYADAIKICRQQDEDEGDWLAELNQRMDARPLHSAAAGTPPEGAAKEAMSEGLLRQAAP